MLEHGCIVTKLHGVIEAKRRRIFKDFMNWVSDKRRKGDVNLRYAIIAEGAKTVGNSAFGVIGMDKNQNRKVKMCDEIQFKRAKNDYFYYDAEEYDRTYEVVKKSKKVKQNMPIQIACSVYDDSKLRMLQFNYDCIDYFIPREDYQRLEMDTDSSYMALAGDFESLVKPHLKKELEKKKYKFFPRQEYKAFDKRTPGLFKVEFEGDGMIALNSKTYFVWNEHKIKCRLKVFKRVEIVISR